MGSWNLQNFCCFVGEIAFEGICSQAYLFLSPDGLKLKLAPLACTGKAAQDFLCKLAGGQNSRLVLTVSAQEKEDLGDRAGNAMPEVLHRQEFISHPLENPSQNTCDLQTKVSPFLRHWKARWFPSSILLGFEREKHSSNIPLAN